MIALSCAAVIVPLVTSASRTLFNGLTPFAFAIPPIDGRVVVVATDFAECDVVAADATPKDPTVTAAAIAPATSDVFFIVFPVPYLVLLSRIPGCPHIPISVDNRPFLRKALYTSEMLVRVAENSVRAQPPQAVHSPYKPVSASTLETLKNPVSKYTKRGFRGHT